MKCGIVDVGSNTMRLSIYHWEGRRFKLLMNKKEMAGLAGYIKEGVLSDSGILVACRVLAGYKALLDNFDIKELHVFGTAPLRNIVNTEEALDTIRAVTGVGVEVLSGADEAALSFLGATVGGGAPAEGLLADIGGGSTEWVCFSQGRIRHAASIPLGSLNLYNRCVETLLPSPKEQAKIRKQVKKALDSAPLPDFPCPVICGVGGTIRGAGKLCNYLYKLPAGNRTITLNMVDGLLERFSAPAKADLQILLKIVPERVHTLLPGLVILSTLAHRCRGDAIEVSSYGVREGFLLTEVLKRRSVTV